MPETVEVTAPGITVLEPIVLVEIIAVHVARHYFLVLAVLAVLPARVDPEGASLESILRNHFWLTLRAVAEAATFHLFLNFEFHLSVVLFEGRQEFSRDLEGHRMLVWAVARLDFCEDAIVIVRIHRHHRVTPGLKIVGIKQFPFNFRGFLVLRPQVDKYPPLSILVHLAGVRRGWWGTRRCGRPFAMVEGGRERRFRSTARHVPAPSGHGDSCRRAAEGQGQSDIFLWWFSRFIRTAFVCALLVVPTLLRKIGRMAHVVETPVGTQLRIFGFAGLLHASVVEDFPAFATIG